MNAQHVQHAQQPQTPAPSFADIMAFQKKLIEARVVDAMRLSAIYRDLGVDLAQGPQPHHHGPIWQKLQEIAAGAAPRQ